MIAMRGQIAAKVRQGLVPALGVGNNSAEAGTHPKNEEAYDLYLRSVSLPHDGTPNREAISMLERAVGLDSTYAPAWRALGERYYYYSHYASGGGAIFSGRLQPMSERWLSTRTSVTLPANLSPIEWREVSWERLTGTRRPW